MANSAAHWVCASIAFIKRNIIIETRDVLHHCFCFLISNCKHICYVSQRSNAGCCGLLCCCIFCLILHWANLCSRKNSIVFGKSTSQRIYPKQHTPKTG